MSQQEEIPSCFLCGNTENNVQYCSICNHSFCDGCRTKYGTRLKAAVDEKMKNVIRKLAW